jgi:hypothetical protein
MSRLGTLAWIVALAVVTACGTSSSVSKVPDGTGGADAVEEVVGEVTPILPDGTSKDVVEFEEDLGITFDAVHELVGCLPGEGCFLDECTKNSDCLSGWCVDYLGEGVCSQSCQEECPQGFSCKLLGGTGPDPVYVCLSDYSNLCKPCTSNADCQSPGGQEDACVSYDDGLGFCGGNCAIDEDCPWGFSCLTTVTVDGISTLQCVAEAGECPCTDKSVELALWTACEVVNEWGTCGGKRICQEDGLSACDAEVPVAETCNGLDDDCDGDVDEPDEVGGDYINLCDDANECTTDSCDGETGCSHGVLDGGECKDGDACTVGDHCEAGECLGAPVLCDDSDPCTDDACDGFGGCQFEENSASCDDGDPCTVADQCDGGSCEGVTVPCDCQEDVDCETLEDGDLCNGTLYCDLSEWPYACRVVEESVVVCSEPEGPDAPCLEALCEPITGECDFVAAHNEVACDDGDACTIGEHCGEGLCGGGVASNCADDNPCTDDSCDGMLGCVYTNNSASCEDGSLCTLNDLCGEGICQPGEATVCDDGNSCTDDSCLPESGCTFSDNEALCDDGNACSLGDVCEDGTCSYKEWLVCADDNVCTSDSCDPQGGCLFNLNSAPCDDGDVCSTGDHCHLGECIAAGQLACDDGNLCTDDSCNAESGCQFVANSAPCDDGDLCTTGDSCAGGWCKPGAMLECEDDNGCTQDLCDPEGGCQFVPNEAPCDDGDACTVGDVCAASECVSGADELDCADSNGCTDDSCDPQSGCVYLNNQMDCDDGSVCTLGDACAGGVCVSGEGTMDCDDDNVCTDHSCDALDGCVHNDNEADCEGGTCSGGACVPSCEPTIYGTAGIGVNNGWNCATVCNNLGGTTVDWVNVQEQIDYCVLLHPGASHFIKNPSNFSYPIYEPQNDNCKVNQNGAQSQGFTGNGTPQYGDQILCRCEVDCPCTPDCSNKECGDDGCGGSCGTCPEGQGCSNFLCDDCAPGSKSFTYSGTIESFQLPDCVTSLTIQATGAEGGRNNDDNHLGGRGASLKGTVTIPGGSLVKILVGGMGEDVKANAGGGGGTFVWLDSSDTLVLAAGGGGGGGYDNAGLDGVTSEGGTNGNGVVGGAGVNGFGGTMPAGYDYLGGGGAGWKSNGSPGKTSSSGCSLAPAAKRPLEGGTGGAFGGDHNYDGNGGFGGGGGGQGGCTVSGGAGGGGGYSGGGPGGYLSPHIRGGGGGGSYNAGVDQVNAAGVNTGNGSILLTW